MLNVKQSPIKQRATETKTPAPTKGLNSVLPYSMMPPQFAIQLNNFIATPSGCTPREGYLTWSTGIPAQTTSLFVYNSRSGTSNKLFAVAGANIYNVTASGAVGAAVVTGLSSSSVYWEYVQQTVTASAATCLIAVNGVNAPQLYDGSSWASCTQTSGGGGVGVFSTEDQNSNSINISAFSDLCLFESYLWFCSAGNTIAYYTNSGAAGGQLYAFDFGPYFPRGGFLQKLATWSIDTGAGVQPLLVAISSKGDVVIYAGTDPSNFQLWGQTGYFELGAPIGQRCVAILNGDLAYLSTDGLFPLSKYLQSARINLTSAITYNISPTISSLIGQYGTLPGWEIFVYPEQNLLLLNVPTGTPSNNIQFCYNTINQSWSQFSGWPSQCFALFDEQPYFGGPTYVASAFNGYYDNAATDGSGGNIITGTCLTAFTDLGMGGQKQVKLVKPYTLANQASPGIQIGVNTDFNLNPVLGTTSIAPVITGSQFDSGLFDVATFGGGLTTYNQWTTPQCWPGEYIALAIAITSNAQITWTSTGWIVAPGGVFG